MQKKLAIYIHWPFCLSLCPYCDFNSHVAYEIDEAKWLEAYKKELSYLLELCGPVIINSIFFGGGTPSLMPVKIVSSIISHIASTHDISGVEITLEANPTSSESSKFRAFQDAGVNRLSLGIQALNDHDLALLGRSHSALEAIKSIELASKYFKNYSFDLIYGRPNQDLKSWEAELYNALNLTSNHISLYMLTIEKGTPFFKLFKDNKLMMPSQDTAADILDLTNDILEKHNYQRYEISNYAKAGFESIHNLSYWNYCDYIGVGPGAHSRITDSEGTNAIMMHHKPEKWVNIVGEQGVAIQNLRRLSESEIISEIIMMSLRIRSGLLESSLMSKTGKSFGQVLNMEYLQTLVDNNMAEYDKRNMSIKLTNQGMNLHNYILARIIL